MPGFVRGSVSALAVFAFLCFAGCGGPAGVPSPQRRLDSPEERQAAARQEESAKQAGEPIVLRNDMGMDLVWIPPSESANERATNTHPFRISRTEVTRGQWKAVMKTEPWKMGLFDDERQGDDCPALVVPWDEAVEFCAKLSERERLAGRLAGDEEYRLPTEAEWEYACRAGSTSVFCFGDDIVKLRDYAWFDDNCVRGECYAKPVAGKLPNAWGLHDMHGNVFEWCSDRYGSDRVVRGGCWSGPAFACGSSVRESGSGVLDLVGFRVVRSKVR